jgi:hypothetical protein
MWAAGLTRAFYGGLNGANGVMAPYRAEREDEPAGSRILNRCSSLTSRTTTKRVHPVLWRLGLGVPTR